MSWWSTSWMDKSPPPPVLNGWNHVHPRLEKGEERHRHPQLALLTTCLATKGQRRPLSNTGGGLNFQKGFSLITKDYGTKITANSKSCPLTSNRRCFFQIIRATLDGKLKESDKYNKRSFPNFITHFIWYFPTIFWWVRTNWSTYSPVHPSAPTPMPRGRSSLENTEQWEL